jgi:signal transduction histidine kinase
LFERRLYAGLLVARVVLPLSTFLVLASASVSGEEPRRVALLWALIALWTGVTTPFVWSRLEWTRRCPWPVRIELALFVLLVFVGMGTRAWHLLHSFVPLVFVAMFASRRAGRMFAAAEIAALWSGHVLFAIRPDAPMEEPLAAAAPTAIVVAALVLLHRARDLLDEAVRLVQAQRAASTAIEAARSRIASQDARFAVHQRVLGQLAPMTRSAIASARTAVAGLPPGTRRDGDGLLACAKEIDRVLVELGEAADAAAWTGPTLREAVELAIRQTEPLGSAVRLELAGEPAAQPGVIGSPAFRRLITEAIANARKHGTEPVTVTVDPPLIVVENAGDPVDRDARRDGYGLEAMQSDADSIGATLRRSDGDGRVVVAIELPSEPAPAEPEPAPREPALRESLRRRRDSYERALLIGRLAFAVLAVGTILTGRDQHRSLVPVLIATSLVLVLWNAALLVRREAVSRAVRRRPRLVWLDAGAMVGLIALQGGMASPWMPLSMGSLMAVGLVLGSRASALLVALLSGAMLAGHGLMLSLPLDDAGTEAQDLPFGWMLNTFVYGAVAAIASGIGWLFRRVDEAAGEYETTRELQLRLESEAHLAGARAETSRDLHASLQQYVAAALMRLGPLRDAAPDARGVDELDRELSELSDTLDAVVEELRAAPRP